MIGQLSVPLAVTGLGMVSSVGRTVTQACASIRAGLSRPRPLPWFKVLDEDEQAPVPLVAHPIHGFTEGFGPIGRWLRLAGRALEDLLEQKSAPPASDEAFWRRTGLIFIGPVLDPRRFPEELQGQEIQEFQQAWLQLLRERLRLPYCQEEAHCVSEGHAGTCTAGVLAARRLARNTVDRFILLAADSCLDAASLRWLASSRRLKTGDMPCGLVPGEAGACLLVESLASARRRGGRVLARLPAAAAGMHRGPFFTESPPMGEGLTNALQAVVSRAVQGRFTGDVLSDMNGEEWRAREWGVARVRASASFGERLRLLLPCTSIGDTGAASGLVSACVAVRSFLRRYSTGAQSLILCSSEYGQAGSFLLQATEASW